MAHVRVLDRVREVVPGNDFGGVAEAALVSAPSSVLQDAMCVPGVASTMSSRSTFTFSFVTPGSKGAPLRRASVSQSTARFTDKSVRLTMERAVCKVK